MSAPRLNFPYSSGGGGGGISGSGTANTLTKWTSSSAVGNSSVTDDGTTLTFTGGAFASTAVSGAVWTLSNTLNFKDTSANTRFAIDPLVGVGIGTQNPASPLHVVGTTTFAGNLNSTAAQTWTLAAASANALNIASGLLNFDTSSSRLTSTGAIRATGTSQTTPAFMRHDATNTGIYFPGVNEIGLTINGNHAVYVTASRNTGFGTTTAARKVDIVSNTPLRMGLSGDYFDFLQVATGNWAWFSSAGAYACGMTTSGNFQMNSGFGSSATAYGCRAWVNFSGAPAATPAQGAPFTLSRTSTLCTVDSTTAHGLTTGQSVYVAAAGITTGSYVVTFVSSTRFEFTTAASGSIAATPATINVLGPGSIRGSGNVSTIGDGGAGVYVINLTNAMPDTNFCVQATKQSNTVNTNCVTYDVIASRGTASLLLYTLENATFVDPANVNVAVFR